MDLRALLSSPDVVVGPAPWADAAHHAAHRLGPAIAAHIAWHTTAAGEVVGALTGEPRALTLRFELSEPGAEQLEVAVRCPRGDCPGPAWQVVDDHRDLLAALDDNADEPVCAQNHD